jgi:hypothetical protein
MTVRTRWILPLAALVSTMATAGCAGDPSVAVTAPPTPPAVATPVATTTPPDPDVAAVAQAVIAYRQMWHAYDIALAVPDPNSPDLARYAASSALNVLTQGLNTAKSQGIKGTGSITVYPQVSEITPAKSPTKVGITDCLDTANSHLVRAGAGPTFNDTPGGRRLCLATVQRQPDGWKVTDFGVRAVGTCT